MTGFRTQTPSKQIGDRDVRELDLAPEIGGGVAAVVASGPVAIGASHYNLFDDTAGDIVADLPDASQFTGGSFFFKKIAISPNNVCITPSTGQLVDGAALFCLKDDRQYVRLFSDGQDWHTIATNTSAARPAGPSAPHDGEAGETYYNTALQMLGYWDQVRGTWLSVQAYATGFQRKGNCPKENYYDAPNDRPMSATYGILIPVDGVVTGVQILRGDIDPCEYILTASGVDLFTIPQTLGQQSTIASGLNVAIAGGSILGVRNSATNITTDVVGNIFTKFQL